MMGITFTILINFILKIKLRFLTPFQLGRCESLLRQLLKKLGYMMPINYSVVFINPEFTLYQAPMNKPIIYPTQINRYLQTLSNTPSEINAKHRMLADKLISLQLVESPYHQLPPYNYQQLRKGLNCAKCNSFSISVEGIKCFCKECGEEEIVAASVMRCVHEINLLFPGQKITTNIVHDWCKVITSKKRISRILSKNFKVTNVRRWSSYE